MEGSLQTEPLRVRSGKGDWGLCVPDGAKGAPEEEEVGSKHLPEKEAKMDKRPVQESILSVCKPSHEWL